MVSREEAISIIFFGKQMKCITKILDNEVDMLYLWRTDLLLFTNKLYDSFEAELKEKDAEINRLRKQLARGHNVECSCSFCWGVPNDD